MEPCYTDVTLISRFLPYSLLYTQGYCIPRVLESVNLYLVLRIFLLFAEILKTYCNCQWPGTMELIFIQYVAMKWVLLCISRTSYN